MKLKHSIAVSMLAVAASALTSCGGKKKDSDDPSNVQLSFWSSFGANYTDILNEIVDNASNQISVDGKTISIEHTSQGSYENVKKEMLSAIADLTYPNMVTGYPDHFAEYLGSEILYPLDDLLENYNEKHGTNLLDDYLPQYMAENYELDVDDDGNKVLNGLPFNKSTELMGYNGVFVDYCASLEAYKEDHLDVVPSTWQEWVVKGPKYREILNSLCKTGTADGKCVYGKQDFKGNASDFNVCAKGADPAGSGRKLLLDFTKVEVENTRVISWDSPDNMFITLIKQWGAEYTYLSDEEKQQDPGYERGDVLFYSSVNKPKVMECMNFFNKLSKQKIFGVPKEFNASYSSTAFENCQVMFMLCSSGGLSYNTAKWENRFRVHALPYYSEGGVERKYVISQGANITLTDATEDYEEAFEAMVAMTTGELQAEWCLQTGYYPCSKSATNSPKYQAFLHAADNDEPEAYKNPTVVAYREGSNVNEKEYMPAENHWNKFVDAAFSGSSVVREVVKHIFEKVFIESSVDDFTKYDQILKEAVTDNDIQQLKANINIVY